MKNMRELHLGEETIRKQRIPSGRKSGFISGSGLGKLAYLQIMWGSQTRLYPCNSIRYMPMIAGIFRGSQNSSESFLALN